MHRRTWLKLGLGAAAVLAIGGGAASLVQPGFSGGKLTPAGRHVFRHAGRAFLQGSLPAGRTEAAGALDSLLGRIDGLIAALPSHAQQELSQLLALLATSAGRRGLAGLGPDWADASEQEIQQALQSMRVSSLALRQQAYHALHDITGSAYFSDSSTWPMLGYPGPVALPA